MNVVRRLFATALATAAIALTRPAGPAFAGDAGSAANASLAVSASPSVVTPVAPYVVPAHTRLRFHVVTPVSSAATRTGEPFTFTMLDPIDVAGYEVVARGAVGHGTVYLSGHAGSLGHEGDLTLRLDDVATVDGRDVRFDDQRFQINGRNRKVASGVLGFVPYVGLASMLIRGSDVHVDPGQPIETELAREAPIVAPRVPGPSAAPSP